MSNKFINLGVEISRLSSDLITTTASNTIINFIDNNDFAIDPTIQFGGLQQSDRTIEVPSIESTSQFSEEFFFDFLIGQLNLVTIDPTIQFGSPQLNVSLDPDSIISTEVFGLNQLNVSYDVPSIGSTLQFGDVEQTEVFFNFEVQPIASTTAFSDNINLDRFVTQADNQSISSTEIVPNPTSFISIGPSSVESDIEFGPPSINRPVHRSLIFKNDNITKLGNDDDVEIASGIVVRTGTAVLNGDTTPNTAAGFVTVVINGTDYKMPFFNL